MHKQLKYILISLLLGGCLTPASPTEHPCETASHCVYDAAAGASNCDEGYTWADPSDADNYNCVSVNDGSCTPTSCDDQDAECGSIPDTCGNTLDCGTCAEGLTCGAGGPNQCGAGECTPTTCTQAGAECSSISDGCGNILDCGTCASGYSCNENVNPPVCVADEGSCVPETCQSLGLDCGTASDGCGGTLDCGPCDTCGNGQIDSGEACDGSNLNGQSCASLGFDTGTLTCNSDCTLDQSQCEDVTCPPNSSYAEDNNGEGGCYCDEGYQVNAAGDGCEPEDDGDDCDIPNYFFYLDDPSNTRYEEVAATEGNSMITLDTASGYMFERCFVGQTGSNCSGNATFNSIADARTYCEDLQLEGYDDWILPPIEVLVSMINDNGVGNSQGIFRTSYLPNSHIESSIEKFMFSGTPINGSVYSMDDPHWGLGMSSGVLGQVQSGAIRCARPTPEADLIQNTPRCLTTIVTKDESDCNYDNNIYCLLNHFEDSATNLEWKRYGDRWTFGDSFDDQEDQCDSITGNWRLPTLAEAFTLYDYSRTEAPYTFFAVPDGRKYWTNASSDYSVYAGDGVWEKYKWLLHPYRAETLLRTQTYAAGTSFGTAETLCVRAIQ